MANYITIFVEKATQRHGHIYDYSMLPNVFTYKDWVTIICPIHGPFSQKARTHASGSGCPACAHATRENKRYSIARHTKEQFIKRARRTHGDKYNYDDSCYTGQMKPIQIMCPIHGPFTQIANNHIHGNGCSQCSDSRGERTIRLMLDNMGVVHIREQKFSDCYNPSSQNKKLLPFDFYIPSKKTLIEYDGKHHFEPVPFNGVDAVKSLELHLRTKENDEIKNLYAQRNGYILIRIKYTLTEEEIYNVISSVF